MGNSNNVLYFPNNIDVRICPKNGMSTLKEAHRKALNMTKDAMTDYRNEHVRKFSDFTDIPFRKNSFRVAVRRDPIDRFKSACEYIQYNRIKFLRKGRVLPKIALEVNQVISDLGDGVYRDSHFYSQTYYMGTPAQYDMIVHIDELPKLLTFLQDACNIERDITNIHSNKTTHKLYNDAIDPERMFQLRNFYLKDYTNGWCKQEDVISF